MKLPEWNRMIITSTDDSIDDGIYIDEDRYRKYLKEIDWCNADYMLEHIDLIKENKQLKKDKRLLNFKVKELRKDLKHMTLSDMIKKKFKVTKHEKSR